MGLFKIMQKKYLTFALFSAFFSQIVAADDKPQITPPPAPKATIPANILADIANTPASKELKTVKKQIVHEQKKLQDKQIQQKRNQEILRQTQAAIAAARRELDDLNRQQRVSWAKLQDLQNRLSQLQTEVENAKAQISRLLVSNYKNQQPNSIVIFLKNADVNQKARFLQYSKYINLANDQVIKKLNEQQEQLEQQETQIHKELDRLKQLAIAQQNKLRQLGQTHEVALADSQKLNGEISSQNNKINTLRENERQLSNVIIQIVAKRNAQRKAEVAQRQKATNKKNAKAPESYMDNKFSRLQGTMRRPVSGSIAGRFGQTRNGGGTWRGVFISTSPSNVQTIAAGEVVYASNLNGYGNTVIIDHADGYVSVYTGLSNISVSVGERLLARQNLGTSGALPTGEQGLYFEIRYRNRPMNPLAWVK